MDVEVLEETDVFLVVVVRVAGDVGVGVVFDQVGLGVGVVVPDALPFAFWGKRISWWCGGLIWKRKVPFVFQAPSI